MNTLLKTLKHCMLGLSVLMIATSSNAGPAHVEVDKHGVILAGHDAVAYFTENAPVLGSSDFTAEYNGATYQFKNAGNRDLFKTNPANYAPEFGGFCAYGTVFGKKFEIDGKAFAIVDGKLYVNKNVQVRETWQEDKLENIESANQQWPVIVDVPASEL
jgi:YHS domain-containing protein